MCKIIQKFLREKWPWEGLWDRNKHFFHTVGPIKGTCRVNISTLAKSKSSKSRFEKTTDKSWLQGLGGTQCKIFFEFREDSEGLRGCFAVGFWGWMKLFFSTRKKSFSSPKWNDGIFFVDGRFYFSSKTRGEKEEILMNVTTQIVGTEICSKLPREAFVAHIKG